MRILLKLLMAPVVAALAVMVWLCSILLYCSSFVLGAAGSIVGLLAVLAVLAGAWQNAVILLVLAFLISPIGLPMIAAWLLGKVQTVRFAIQRCIYG